MSEFNDSERAAELAARARALMDEVVVPKERALSGGATVSAGTVADLRAAAREYGVYAPQIDQEWDGMGIDFRDVLPTFEEAGRSLLGPTAMRVDAPDEGNMHLLELVGTDLQREHYLKPLVAGEIASGFSMTEPLPGAGSDPKTIRTTARREGDEWVIDGHKWWTTQGVEADVLIVFARTDPDAHPYSGCSLFLVPSDAPGVEVVRNIPHLGGGPTGISHAEIRYHGVRVPEEHLLGEEGEGFRHVQERLGPARLTHCMRFSGMARRSLDVAAAYVAEREAFGDRLADKQAVRFAIADAETDLHAARATVRNAAERIAAGHEARTEVAMAKVFTATAVQEIVDTALQLCGGSGIGRDLPLADFYATARQFRIIDGADEVHRRTIARDAFEDVDRAELDALTRYDG
ncbi:acyl-CoA dehydrogenase family protein [Halomarina halobia]|uniref:Acyl-CoA dehydrogenase family protein n=1 Tax=Halomarina halobia TaxID=3033386 RepID=A0ABD6ADN4_9EURY|nr:acyl-CoA dehydrogenase family protein [Halomarina sp. PSR21]